MKATIDFEQKTYQVTTVTDKKATSNYDTNLTVSFENKAIAGCIVKKTDSKDTVMSAAKKCIKMYLTTNYFN